MDCRSCKERWLCKGGLGSALYEGKWALCKEIWFDPAPRASKLPWNFEERLEGDTRLGATGPRVSERKASLREGLREPPTSTLVMKIKSQKRISWRVFGGPLGGPLGGKSSSRRLSVLLPLIVSPLQELEETQEEENAFELHSLSR